MAPSARLALAAGQAFLCRLALADNTVDFEAVPRGRRLTFEDYTFDEDLPPDRPVTDAQFFDPDFRQGVFQECGGKGKITYKCEEGCSCEVKDGNEYSKRCTPPEGKKTCSAKVAKLMLSKQEDKAPTTLVEELDRLVKTAEKEKEDSEAEVKRWARKAVVAKKEADAAEKAFYAAESSDTQRVKTRENDLIEELHEMRTEVIPQKTREVWEKYAKVISEAEAKVEKAKADLATASEDLVKKSKADDQVLKKLAAEVKEIEQKKAAMELPAKARKAMAGDGVLQKEASAADAEE
ncbi:unnamed protein product [Prorocentrum cordatum]|uniref:Uncharacterized protein n=1 Tax=Prorocentrum cordatum TaxID=2364126 RepID=A0ABN9U7N8_9DINO|nr:unnamed protein product [Polarella glacialis]